MDGRIGLCKNFFSSLASAFHCLKTLQEIFSQIFYPPSKVKWTAPRHCSVVFRLLKAILFLVQIKIIGLQDNAKT